MTLGKRWGERENAAIVSRDRPLHVAESLSAGDANFADMTARVNPVRSESMTELERAGPAEPAVTSIDRLENPSPPPTRGEPGTTWECFDADLPAVVAELAVVAPEFRLVADGDRAWRHEDAETDLLVIVAAEPDGPRTAVGVRIAALQRRPVVYEVASSIKAYLVALVAGSALIATIALGIVGMPLWQAPFAFLAAFVLLVFLYAPFYGLTLGVIEGVQAIALRRARTRWKAAWHRRFWPALTARITERPPYR